MQETMWCFFILLVSELSQRLHPLGKAAWSVLETSRRSGSGEGSGIQR